MGNNFDNFIDEAIFRDFYFFTTKSDITVLFLTRLN